MKICERQLSLTTSTVRPDVTTKISKTARPPSPAPAVPLPPPPHSNIVPKPLTRQAIKFDAGVKEVIGKNSKTNKLITNYKTIVNSSGVSLVRVRAPTVNTGCSNEWSTIGKNLSKTPFKNKFGKLTSDNSPNKTSFPLY